MTKLKELDYEGRKFVYDTLVPEHDDEELDQIEESYRRFGDQGEMLHTHDDLIVAGVGRMMVHKRMGTPLSELRLREVSVEDPQLFALTMNTVGRKWTKETLVLAAHRLKREKW